MPPIVAQGWMGRGGDVSARGRSCSSTGSGCLIAQSHTATVYLIAMSTFVKPRVRDSQQLIGVWHGLVVGASNTQVIPTTLAIQNFIRSLKGRLRPCPHVCREEVVYKGGPVNQKQSAHHR